MLYGGAKPDGTGVSSETVTGNRFCRLSGGGKYGPDADGPRTFAGSGNVWDGTRHRVSSWTSRDEPADAGLYMAIASTTGPVSAFGLIGSRR